MRREPAHLHLGARRDLAHAPADDDHRQYREREDDGRHRRQPPVLIEHHRHQPDHRQRLLGDAGERGRHSRAQQVHVDREARDQRARRGVVEERQVGGHEMGVEPLLHVGDDALADDVHQHRLAIVGGALGGEHRHHHERYDHEHVAVGVGEHLVEHRLHHPRGAGRRRGDDRHAGEREKQAAEVGAHLLAHQALDQHAGRQVG